MTLLVAIFSVLFGLAFGSFLNVCIARLQRRASIVRPASHCPACGNPIQARDNIPVLSWILLRGRCRHCRWPIPWRYPLVELGTALLFLLANLKFGATFEALGMAVLCFLLFGLAIMDAETLLLPDAFTLPGIALGVMFNGLTGGWRAAAWSAVYALGAAALILLIRATYWLVRRREGMGLGDAKLLALIAAWLGLRQTLLVLFLGVVSAAIFGLLWIWRKKARPAPQSSQSVLVSEIRAHPSLTQLPLGSFLCAAAIYAIFCGEQTLKWYLQFFR